MNDQPASSAPHVEIAARLNKAVAGARLTDVKLMDYTWVFTFGEDWELMTEAYWRVIAGKRLTVSSGDDGQWFGLSEPLDAAARVLATLNSMVTRLEITEAATDLRIHFGDDILELLNTSCGYESWRLSVKQSGFATMLVALGGGGLSGLP